MLSIAEQLSRHRARYLSYVKFTPQLGYAYVDTAKTEIYIPSNSTITDYKYKLTIVDLSDRTRSLHANEASGQGWYMLASPNPSGILKANENLLLDSVGLRCMSVAVILITATDCGSSGVPWE
jgi:type IV pilus assembly protein PilE